MLEVIVRVKGEDQILNRKFLCYEENVQMNHDDPHLKKMVEATISDFKGEVEDVLVKIKYTW